MDALAIYSNGNVRNNEGTLNTGGGLGSGVQQAVFCQHRFCSVNVADIQRSAAAQINAPLPACTVVLFALTIATNDIAANPASRASSMEIFVDYAKRRRTLAPPQAEYSGPD